MGVLSGMRIYVNDEMELRHVMDSQPRVYVWCSCFISCIGEVRGSYFPVEKEATIKNILEYWGDFPTEEIHLRIKDNAIWIDKGPNWGSINNGQT